MDFWRTKKFKALFVEWNLKLEQSGFTDAEIDTGKDRSLKQRATNSYRQENQLEREAKIEYYLLVGQHLNETSFNLFNYLDYIIMSLHSDGFTIQEIVKDLEFRGISKDRKTIRYIIRRWQMKWGIREWNPKQMNLKK